MQFAFKGGPEMNLDIKIIQGLLPRKDPERTYWTLKAKIELAIFQDHKKVNENE